MSVPGLAVWREYLYLKKNETCRTMVILIMYFKNGFGGL